MAWRGARVVVAAVVATAVLLILLDVRGLGTIDAVRGAVGTVAGPPERALAWVRTQATDRFGGAAGDRARIAELEQELADTRAVAAAAAAQQLTEAEARALATQAPAQGYTSVPGRVLAATATQARSRGVAVSTGGADGVQPGLAVVAAAGLAGLVEAVAPQIATVRLIIDPASQLAARVAGTGEMGVLQGTGDAGRFELLDPLGEMSAGDLIVTLGDADGAIPAGLPMGRIERVSGSAAAMTRVAHVVPVVDDSTMDRVALLVPDRPGPR